MSRDARYSRHVAVDGFGALGQHALRRGRARVEVRGEAEVVAAMFLAAGGVGELELAGIADADAGADVTRVRERARDTTMTTLPLPSPSPLPTRSTTTTMTTTTWTWPEGAEVAKAMFEGGAMAARWMIEARARADLTEPALRQIFALADAALPRECCGYVVGDEVMACENVAAEDDAYAFADADLVRFVKTLDSERPARLVYHSHPNGRAYFSDRDRAIAATPSGPVYPVDHLVVGADDAALFGWDGTAYVEVARYPRPC